MARRITEKQKQEIVDAFINNKSLEEISENFKFTKLTIVRHLKKIFGKKRYDELLYISKSSIKSPITNDRSHQMISSSNSQKNLDEVNQELFLEDTFHEITPLNLEIDNLPHKDLSSVSIKEVDLPKVVYMIVDKQVELETKLLKEYIEWSFLSEEDLNRKTIEIFYDLKAAKRSVKKEQRVIKVPDSNVFNITAPILRARGISRIVSSELLIAL